jgi:hypothetical protein
VGKIYHEDTKKKGEKEAKERFLWHRISHFSAFFLVSSCLCGESSSLFPHYQPLALAEESSIPVAGMRVVIGRIR